MYDELELDTLGDKIFDDPKNPDDKNYRKTALFLIMSDTDTMSVQLESGVDYDSMMKEFRNILDMLKHNFYKEEYLP